MKNPTTVITAPRNGARAAAPKAPSDELRPLAPFMKRQAKMADHALNAQPTDPMRNMVTGDQSGVRTDATTGVNLKSTTLATITPMDAFPR